MNEPQSGTNPQNESRQAKPLVVMGAKREPGRGGYVRPDNPVQVTPFGRFKIDMLSPAFERLADVLLTNSDAVVFKAPCKISGVVLFPTNVDTNIRTVTIGHGASGATTVTATNARCMARPLKVGNCNIEDAIVIPGMDKDEVIIAKCDTTQLVNLQIYGQRIDK